MTRTINRLDTTEDRKAQVPYKYYTLRPSKIPPGCGTHAVRTFQGVFGIQQRFFPQRCLQQGRADDARGRLAGGCHPVNLEFHVSEPSSGILSIVLTLEYVHSGNRGGILARNLDPGKGKHLRRGYALGNLGLIRIIHNLITFFNPAFG